MDRDLVCMSWLKKALGYGRQKQVLWCTGWFDIEAVTFGRKKWDSPFEIVTSGAILYSVGLLGDIERIGTDKYK